MPKNKPQWLSVKFKMPKNYRHISLLYVDGEMAAIIEAHPPRRIKSFYNSLCDKYRPRVYDWIEQTMDRIRIENNDL